MFEIEKNGYTQYLKEKIIKLFILTSASRLRILDQYYLVIRYTFAN